MEEGQPDGYNVLIEEIKALRAEIISLKSDVKQLSEQKTNKPDIIANYKKCSKCKSHLVPPLNIKQGSISRIIECPICGNTDLIL